MEPSAAELFAVYKAHSLETMTARGTLFSPKQAPTVVEHWKELEPYLDRVGTRHTPAQVREQFRLLISLTDPADNRLRTWPVSRSICSV